MATLSELKCIPIFACAGGVAYWTIGSLAGTRPGRMLANENYPRLGSINVGVAEMTGSEKPNVETLTSNQLAKERTDLADARTLMAADRSLMAWIRTGLAMISFGFTIYKLLEGFQEKGAALDVAQSPRVVGLFLTGLGTISIVMGTIEYWERRRELITWGPIRIWRPSFVMALLVSIAGLVLFFGITARLL